MGTLTFLLGLLGISTTTALVAAAVVFGGGLISILAWKEFIVRHWKPIAIVGTIIIVGLGSYMRGASVEHAKCEAEALRLKIAQLERDIAVQKEADKIEDSEMSRLKAEKMADDAEILLYEASVARLRDELIKQGKDPDCDSLTQEEIDMLINHGKGKKKPKSGGPR